MRISDLPNDCTDLTTDAGVDLTITKLLSHLSSGVQSPETQKEKVENAMNQYSNKNGNQQSLSNVPQLPTGQGISLTIVVLPRTPPIRLTKPHPEEKRKKRPKTYQNAAKRWYHRSLNDDTQLLTDAGIEPAIS
jgi:hypothetical protein